MMMIGAIRDIWDRFRGAGSAALSVPTLDGPFKPNDLLEEAPVRLAWPAPDNLACAGGRLFLSSGGTVLEITGPGTAEQVETGPAEVTAMAGAPDGTLAVARSGAGIRLAVNPGGGTPALLPEGRAGDITAMAFAGPGRLALTIGSERYRARDWRFDLMTRGASGSAWLCAAQGGATRLAEGLAYANGIAEAADGRFLVSESWAARLLLAGPGAAPRVVLPHLPGYPARLCRADGGGYWMALFAPRNQMIEFVLREPAYRARMMREIDQESWLAPMLRPTDDPKDPMLKGVQRVAGSEVRPWGLSLSQGIVARLDDDFLPLYSMQSRAHGRRHGVTSVIDCDGELLAASRCGYIVSLPRNGG